MPAPTKRMNVRRLIREAMPLKARRVYLFSTEVGNSRSLAIPTTPKGRSTLAPDAGAPTIAWRDALTLLQAHTRTTVEGRGRYVSRAIRVERRSKPSLRRVAAV